MQLVAFALQAKVPQTLVASQYAEQHSELKPQVAPFAAHGSAHRLDPLQYPEQQSPLPLQGAALAAQLEGGWHVLLGEPAHAPAPPTQQSASALHVAPVALHGFAQLVPLQNPEQQSVAPTVQVIPLSVHAAVQTRVFGSQTTEVQSAGIAQESPFAHFDEQDPPQSTSVSVPFLNPSPQVGAAHRCDDGLQKPEVQSAATRQPLAAGSPPDAHVLAGMSARQVAPPQSVPVSLPFLAPSAQVGVAQTCEGLRSPEPQSDAERQLFPFAQVSGG